MWVNAKEKLKKHAQPLGVARATWSHVLFSNTVFEVGCNAVG